MPSDSKRKADVIFRSDVALENTYSVDALNEEPLSCCDRNNRGLSAVPHGVCCSLEFRAFLKPIHDMIHVPLFATRTRLVECK
eukprot:IDg8898t1